MTGEKITYNQGVIADFAAHMGSQAAQLHGIHDHVLQRTNDLAEWFIGHGATEFNDLQHQMLSGLSSLIETIQHHQQAVISGASSADATDRAIAAAMSC